MVICIHAVVVDIQNIPDAPAGAFDMGPCDSADEADVHPRNRPGSVYA